VLNVQHIITILHYLKAYELIKNIFQRRFWHIIPFMNV